MNRAFLRPLAPLPGLIVLGVALRLQAPVALLAAAWVLAAALTIGLYRWSAR